MVGFALSYVPCVFSGWSWTYLSSLPITPAVEEGGGKKLFGKGPSSSPNTLWTGDGVLARFFPHYPSHWDSQCMLLLDLPHICCILWTTYDPISSAVLSSGPFLPTAALPDCPFDFLLGQFSFPSSIPFVPCPWVASFKPPPSLHNFVPAGWLFGFVHLGCPTSKPETKP